VTPAQRRALLIAGGIVAVAAVVIAVLVLPGGDDDGDDVATVTSTSLETTTTVRPTTIPLQPVTTPPPGETTTTTGIATTAAPAPVVDGQGAVLARPATASTRTRPQGSGCASLGMTGYSVRCGEVEDGSDTFAWLVERHNVTGGIRVSVLREAGEDRFTVVLEALDDGPAGPARFSAVGVRSQDLSADGTPEFVFGFRNQGSGAILDVDVVDAPGRVVVHRSLDKGRAEVSDGRLDVWAAEFGPNDASCCPSRYRHGLIRRTEGAWRLVSSTLEPPGAVPEGDFA
jgi:hypothetical protein